MSTSDVVVAKSAFSATLDGRPRAVRKGETFRSGHPVVEGREELFKPFELDNDIEQATAAPGEKRSKRPRAKKTEKKLDEPAAAEQKGSEAPGSDKQQATAAPGEKDAGTSGQTPSDVANSAD